MTDIKFTSENLTCEGQTSSNITVDRAPDSRFRGHGFKSQSGPSIFLPSHYHVTFGAYDQPLEMTG